MFCLPHFSFGKWSPGGTAPLLRTSLILSFPGRLRVPPEHSWGVAPWQTHSGSVLPSCFLRALYSSHCSTNVTIVSLHGILRMKKKSSPSGEREGESYSHLKCWSQGNALVLSEDACCLTYYGKWGQGPGAVWQGALLVTTANSSGLWWLPLGWPLALLIISGASLLLSNLSPICSLRIVICTLAVLSRLGDLSSKHLLPPALEAGSPRSRFQPVWCVMRVCLLVCRRLPSCFVLSWQECKLWSLPFL